MKNEGSDGKAPLHYAAYWGKVESVERLLRYGADIAATNNNGRTARQLAVESNEPEIVALLDRWAA